MNDNQNVSYQINEALNGIELAFSKKPSLEILDLLRKDHIYRWHPVKKLWYARNSDCAKEIAIDIIQKTDGRSRAEIERAYGMQSNRSEPAIAQNEAPPNTFASYYAAITDSIPITKEGKSLRLLDKRGSYVEDLNLYYHVYNSYQDSQIQIIDLTEAQKRGKTCTKYTLSCPASEQKELISMLEQKNILSVHDLWNAVKTNDERLNDISIDTYEVRSVDVFSPFIEVTPLKKMPEKWTRANLVQALLSGQIYKGEVSYRYTDDYAYDAAYGFGTGCRLNLAKTAQDIIENWYSTSSISGSVLDNHKEKAILHYSVHSNSSDTLYFDLTFDHKKGQEYRLQEQQAIARFNQRLKNSVIHPDYNQIDEGKIYQIQLIEPYTNSGIYDTKTETIQGYRLQEYLKEDDNLHLENLIGFQEMAIVSDHYYSIDPENQACLKTDSRIIQADPHTVLVTGKALLELCAEKTYVNDIREDYAIGKTYADIKKHIESFQSGKSFFMFSDNRVDYEAALRHLERETKRAKEPIAKDIHTMIDTAERKREGAGFKGKGIEFPQRA